MANKQLLKIHENILIFYKKMGTYNPQKNYGKPYKDKVRPSGLQLQGCGGRMKLEIDNDGGRYPTSVLFFPNPNNNNLHPTQKPVGLFEYLIRTYTNEGDLVFDGFGGSGTTAIAAHKSKRNFIVIEKEKKYFDLATKRLKNERAQFELF